MLPAGSCSEYLPDCEPSRSSKHNSVVQQDAKLSQGVPRDAAVNFGATGIIDI